MWWGWGARTLERGAHGRVNVLRQHGGVHADAREQVAAPAAVAAAKHADAEEARAPAVAHIVHVLELRRHDVAQEAVAADGAGALKDVVAKALHGRDRVRRMVGPGVVVGVHDEDVLDGRRQLGETAVHVLGLAA